MERGLFLSESNWTCYRRNYFQLTSMLVLPSSDNTTVLCQQKLVRRFLLKLTARSSEDRPVELIQLTTKRDKGPRITPPSLAIRPGEWGTFRRIQFKSATANNGKKRASQQYFSLVIELLAELDDASQETIARCQSVPIVVRGRSPSHYGEIYPYTRKRLFDGESMAKRKRTATVTGVPASKMGVITFDHTRSLSANDYQAQHFLDQDNSNPNRAWELGLPGLPWSAHERTESTNTFVSIQSTTLGDYTHAPYRFPISFGPPSSTPFAVDGHGMLD
ncbi:hypothetical protein EC973_001262 [Apophysomyces ossiformis]|uniref:NDT80 domain-containing protein n=1 Tax=Apophysomyces ossiformis TaxID=679940 RepID=A0A8H7BM95_9FUNG|nr:hypothetical protein EC973_001262 [Apophysomyces ossiformis]